jgi:heme a synthase
MTRPFTPALSVSIWLAIGIILILVMVSIGGLTRLTHSGLSMVHWTFTGSLPPMDDAEWVNEFERYQTSPEFKELHEHFEIEDFKSIFWWEYIHRMFGRMIGIIFLIPFVFFWLRRYIPKDMLPQFGAIFMLGAFQAVLGWFMVKSGLSDAPRVSHFRLSAHLITAFLTCAYIFWVMLNYKEHGKLKSNPAPIRKGAIWFFTALVIQIIYGGFVAGLRAGWMHNTWPLMDGSLVAPSVWAMDPVILNFFEGGSGVQFVHRTLALIILVASFFLVKSAQSQSDHIRKPAMVILGMVLLQFTLGVATLLLAVPTSFAVAHQVMALITLLSSVWLLHSATYSPVSVDLEP